MSLSENLTKEELERIAIAVKYKNWKGEIAIRKIAPAEIYFDSSEYHKDKQWLLKVWDLDKKDYGTYALKDILSWEKFP